ncbi:ankyrin repeat-containing domain protein [Aspergillus pseudoustus]|uniref:Ankyrin repeat-containing domain protein n=1 Tax=Aspergillus pseudoustus TaxID=1810923 RepID=A0ABR4J4B8_9EURO
MAPWCKTSDAKQDIPRIWEIPEKTGRCTLRPFTEDLDKVPKVLREYARFIAACEAGDSRKVRQMLAADEKKGAKKTLLSYDSGLTKSMYTPLEAACGHLEIVQILLDAGVDPMLLEFLGVARLVCSGNLTQAVLDLLLKNKLLLTLTKSGGVETVLHYACAHGAPRSAIDLLLANGVTPDPEGAMWKLSPLHHAIESHADDPTEENLDFVRWLLSKPEFQHQRSRLDPRRNTPLHYAAMEGDVGVANLLLREFDADVNKSNDAGWTPLCTALTYGERGGFKVVPVLLKAGASVTAADCLKKTPLHYAIEDCHDKAVAAEGSHQQQPKDLIRMVFDAWVAEAGYERPNLLLLAAARLEDIPLMKKLLPMCKKDKDLDVYKQMIDFIRAALADEKQCIPILRQAAWWEADPDNKSTKPLRDFMAKVVDCVNAEGAKDLEGFMAKLAV